MKLRNLLAQLSDAGLHYSASELRELIHGLASAPNNAHNYHWLELVTPKRNAAIDHTVIELFNEAVSRCDGLINRTEPKRLKLLRAELLKNNLGGFIVPKSDEHQGEYIAKKSERLWWLTGFSGSAGIAVVLLKTAAIFVDGRYTLQLETEVDPKFFYHKELSKLSPVDWTLSKASTGLRIGFDPWLMTPDQITFWNSKLEGTGIKLIPLRNNPIDQLWSQQPAPPISPIFPHRKIYAGKTSAQKKTQLTKVLKTKNIGAIVLTQPDSICWLLNVRGSDIPFSPLVLSFAIFYTQGDLELFVDTRKLTPKARKHLKKNCTTLNSDHFSSSLKKLTTVGTFVQLDPKSTPFWIENFLRKKGAKIQYRADPCQLIKAQKNIVEIKGAKTAHLKDGIALCALYSWLNKTSKTIEIDEISIDRKLESLRGEDPHYKGPSFAAITGSGPNGAIVHYRVSPETNRKIKNGELLLLDCGAQYPQGTTDVTRTIAFGTPSNEMRDHFTRVLKGHIALAAATFPAGTSGAQLDTLARQYLWKIGLDFEHGTGHGVGSFLSVHEGPQRISKGYPSVALQPGMIISNEPGYYKKGEYGIRIENLILVVEKSPKRKNKRATFGFETLTLAPIDQSLIDVKLMDSRELEWLNSYHKNVLKKIGPLLKTPDRIWLEAMTKNIEL